MNLGRLGALVCGLLIVLLPQAALPAPLLLFGTVEFRSDSLDALPQWQRVLAEIREEERIYEACRRNADACPSAALADWQRLVGRQSGRPKLDQLQAVNDFVNRWRYITDQQNYGRSDYWATPVEFFARAGDCEDYAIAKYVTLRQLGFAAEDLRLVVVQDATRDIAHAILAAHVDTVVYVLDNLSERILPQQRVGHYSPYYSLNETARWAHARPVLQADAMPAGRISIKPYLPRQ
jgi:predicted transglutaminase-like cysteine proteinase